MKAELLEKLQAVEPSTRDALFLMVEEFTNQSKLLTIGRADFEELKIVVRDLAVAQARTEQRVDTLAIRMEALAEAQEQTNQSIKELTQAQARTEVALQKLTESDADIRKQMGGLAMAVGYGLEDRLMPHIPAFAGKTFGINAQIVDRRNIVYPDGRYDEANLYVEGEKDGQTIYLIGECKSQPGKRDFDKFAGLLGRVREYKDGEVLGMMIGYQYAPDVEDYARTNYPTIRFFKTFEVERATAVS